MRFNFVFTLFSILITATNTNKEPNQILPFLSRSFLTRAFVRLQNCELYLLQHKVVPSDISLNNLFLPTTILSVEGYKLFRHKIYDISQVRPLPCRVIFCDNFYAANRALWQIVSLYFHKTGMGLEKLSSRKNIFTLLFLKDEELLKLERDFKLSDLEFLGALKIHQDGRLEICLIFQAYKPIPPELQVCTDVLEHNVVEIFGKLVQRPREWLTTGGNLGIPNDLRQVEIASLTQNQLSSPMDRRNAKVNSPHLHHLQLIFSKNNASLVFYNAYFYDKHTISLFGYDILPTESTDDGDVHIVTGIEGYSFLSCFSKKVIIFDFYFTPFQPKVWIGLITGYLVVSCFLGIYLFTAKIKGSLSPWLFTLGALLEDGIPVTSKIEKQSWFRVLTGSWILAAVILTNCYNGLVITELNSPLQLSINTFKKLVCNWQAVNYSWAEYHKMKNTRIRNSTVSVPRTNFDLDAYIEYFMHWIDGKVGKVSHQLEYPKSEPNCFRLLSAPRGTSQSDADGHPEFLETLVSIYQYYKMASTPVLSYLFHEPYHKRHE